MTQVSKHTKYPIRKRSAFFLENLPTPRLRISSTSFDGSHGYYTFMFSSGTSVLDTNTGNQKSSPLN